MGGVRAPCLALLAALGGGLGLAGAAAGQRGHTAAGGSADATLEGGAAQAPAAVGGGAQVVEEALGERLLEQGTVGALPLAVGGPEVAIETVVGEHGVGGAVGVAGIARPGVGAGPGRQTVPDRIAFDVAHAVQQMCPGLDRRRPVAPLPAGSIEIARGIDLA